MAWPNVGTRMAASGPAPGSEAVSSPTGEFRLEGLDPTLMYVLRATKPGWGDRRLAKRLVSVNEPAEVVLSPTATLLITCIDGATSLPVSAASMIWSTPKGFAQLPTTNYARAIGALSERSREARNVIQLVRKDPRLGLKEEHSLRMRAFGFGYHSTQHVIKFMLATTQDVPVPLTPLERTVLRPVRFTATFPGGEKFDGSLMVQLAGGAGPAPGSVKVSVVGGRSERSVLLPIGPLSMRVAGAGESGFWWKPAAPPLQEVLVDSDEEQEIALVVEGNPVLLDVRDSSGQRVRGLDVEVFFGGVSRGRWSVWDSARSGSAGATVQSMMLPPGECRVVVRVPGLGRGVAELQLSGDGTPVERVIRLQPADDPRAEQREAFERRLRERFGR